MPSACSITLGITICLPSAPIWHSAKHNGNGRGKMGTFVATACAGHVTEFAECRLWGTRQRSICRVSPCRHSANTVTCTAHDHYHERYPVATNVTMLPRPLPLLFAECQLEDTRQTMLCRVPDRGTLQRSLNAECNGPSTRHSGNFAECLLWHSANNDKNFLQQPPNFFLCSHTMWRISYLNVANYLLCLLYLDYLFH